MPVLIAACRSFKIASIVCLLASGVMYLSTFWTVKSLLVQCFRRDSSGTHVLYRDSLCRIRTERCGQADLQTFYHQRCKYLLQGSQVKKIAPKLDLPLAALRRGTLQRHYELFPRNSVRIPTPSFLRLFKEQCVTPLFCFQIFSSMLMAFDDYVLQSVFSTMMIVFVEAVLVFSRVFTISQFRTLDNKECELIRLDTEPEELEERNSAIVSSVDIKPSDVIKIVEPIEIPCDLVILRGSCAVNEAMLSGESVPLPKEAIPDTSEIFDLKKHRRHVLFAGTKIEKMEGELYARAIRTSFDTEQGALLNKMLNSEDIKYDPEALRFILVLTGLSLISSIFTFFYSKKSGYPLFIDIIVLFTNSIPFELPMEMGISVQRAVKQLSVLGIHCLEPFRITLAGKIDVCCFDKTGTLTDSKLVLRRVVGGNEGTNRILCCCHGLIAVEGVLRGDPLDCAIFDYLSSRDELRENEGFAVLKQFTFTSELKRQCVVAEFGGDRIFAMKGAPEAVSRYLKHVPDNYNEYLKYAASGNRVIALAYKPLPQGGPVRDVQSYYEKDLVFAGFLLFGCRLKEHAIEMCRTLQESNHLVLMITGDNLLTAMSVAEQLGLGQVGVEGPSIDVLLEAKGGDRFLKTRVFARAEPRHKELIIKKYRSAGYHTMMVGDGTNDVGALKAADVGVAMLETPVATAGEKRPIKKNPASFREAMAGLSEGPAVKPGDASVAAPFTVKSNSLKSIIEIIQQGRSSLVTTIQMYKILALNSITNAFFMSFADIIGIKFSEYQMFAVGLLSAVAFQAISNGKPLSYISRLRPLTTIFSRYILVSIAGQSLVHILTFVAIYRLFPLPAVETKFKPSTMNTILFIVTCMQTVSVFASNYIGRPFRENISENTLMLLSLTGLFAFVVNTVVGIHRELNDLLEVVDVREYSVLILLLVLGNSLISYLVEVACFRLFMLGS